MNLEDFPLKDEFRGFEKIPRWSRDVVITEKIDGTNGQIMIVPAFTPLRGSLAIKNMGTESVADPEMPPILNLFAGSKNRWLGVEKDQDNHGFGRWAMENADDLFNLGIGRHFGEWWGQGIQRGYDLKEKRFSLFNVKKWRNASSRPRCCDVVPVLAYGLLDSDINLVEVTMHLLKSNGSYAAPGFMRPEGIVIYHTAANVLFKKTFENDEGGKLDKKISWN